MLDQIEAYNLVRFKYDVDDADDHPLDVARATYGPRLAEPAALVWVYSWGALGRAAQRYLIGANVNGMRWDGAAWQHTFLGYAFTRLTDEGMLAWYQQTNDPA